MDIEQRAIDRGAVALVRVDCGGYAMRLVTSLAYQLPDGEHWLMPVEAHDAFRQEVSEAVKRVADELSGMAVLGDIMPHISRFIIQSKTDPLVEAVTDLYGVFNEGSGPVDATDYFRAALASRGLEIREVGE